MNEETYSFTKEPEIFYYEFFSEGPKGKVKKVVRYRLLEEFPNLIYNLGFGDWDNKQGNMNDRVVTNNHDRQKVLATVADTVIDFTKCHSNVFIFAQGSTSARTRLYQMGIASFWNEIAPLFL